MVLLFLFQQIQIMVYHNYQNQGQKIALGARILCLSDVTIRKQTQYTMTIFFFGSIKLKILTEETKSLIAGTRFG